MSTWLLHRRYIRVAGPFVRASAIAMLCLSIPVEQSNAQSLDAKWTAEPRFYLSGMSFYQAKDDASAAFDTLAATGELRFRPYARPWYASLFADYRFSTDRSYSDRMNIGGLINYGRYRWDARAYAFVNKSPRSDDIWLYMGRLRYRFAGEHKVGLEAAGAIGNPKSLQLMLGYYGTISDSLSMTVAAGRGTSGDPDLSARLELVWRIF